MKKKTEKWYEVIYTEDGKTYQVIEKGKREAKALHKAHAGSTFREIVK